MITLLSTTYFGPVQWYQKLYRAEHVEIERCFSETDLQESLSHRHDPRCAGVDCADCSWRIAPHQGYPYQ